MYRFNNNSCCQCNCSMNKKNNSFASNCGFKKTQSVFPTNPMLGQSYVPIQEIDKTFTPTCGLKNGTIFPELVNTYYPGQSMMDIDYLRMSTNVSMEV